MGVMKEGLSAWPETVAYKRMLRNLIRAQEYVPPQQPTGSGPLLEVEVAPTSTAAVDGASDGEQPAGTDGAETTIAPNPEREDRG